MKIHPHVPHPRSLIPHHHVGAARFNDVVGRYATTTLGSMTLFWACFAIPLLTLPLADNVKLIVSILFSSWFQAWALPVLQRSSNQADVARNAKADADHEALSHLATVVDEIRAAVGDPKPAGKK